MNETALLLMKGVGLWLALTLVASLIAAWAYPTFARQLQRSAPAGRSMLRMVYGLMPVFASSLVVLFMSHPALAGLLVPAHCHAGECGAHVPVLGSGTLASVGFAAFGALGGFLVLAASVWVLRGAARRLGTLHRLTRRMARDDGHRVVEVDGLIACCVGLLRPEVLVSRGLMNALPAAQLQAVLAHEQAHAKRRDNLRGFLVHAATLAWPGTRRRQLRTDLAADAEQACDVAAARSTGDAGLVIDAMRGLAALGGQAALGRSVSFCEGSMADRIDALSHGPVHGRSSAWALTSLAGFWLLLVSLLTALSHGFLEWLTAFGL